MIDVLLVTNSAKNIRFSWRHFCTKDYNATSAVNNDVAVHSLITAKKGTVPVYYCGDDTDCFIDFYRKLRSEKKTADIPLVVLADMKWIKPLSDYVHLKNTCVIGVAVNETKLLDVMRTASKGGFEKKSASRHAPSRQTGRR